MTSFTLDLKYLKGTCWGGCLEIHKADFVEQRGFRLL